MVEDLFVTSDAHWCVDLKKNEFPSHFPRTHGVRRRLTNPYTRHLVLITPNWTCIQRQLHFQCASRKTIDCVDQMRPCAYSATASRRFLCTHASIKLTRSFYTAGLQSRLISSTSIFQYSGRECMVAARPKPPKILAWRLYSIVAFLLVWFRTR